MWIVVETYYKHGEHQLHVFHDDTTFKLFLDSKIHEYDIDVDDVHDDDDYLAHLAELVEEQGIARVEQELGWGCKGNYSCLTHKENKKKKRKTG